MFIFSPLAVTTEELQTILDWKFAFYNRNNNDDVLEDGDFVHFRDEVYELINTKTFVKQLKKKIDTNDNDKLSKTEWNDFYGE